MAMEPGHKLLHYCLVEKIGAGGMGVVWKARDEKLRRDVALKVLPPERTKDPDRRQRLLQEARAAAAINHPNIGTIHEINEADGVVFIAMELVEGDNLRTLMAKGQQPIPDALGIAVRIARGLVHAHRSRVVHRDLKPENVIVGPEGQVKILDFGLAKVFEKSEVRRSQLSRAETVTERMTHEGSVLGTAAYMSPEQAAGKLVDSRSDVFSFGIVLYELVAGHRPFRGETTQSTLAKIQEAEPEPISELRNDLPPELERIVQRCLRKKPDDRYNDTRDLLVALKDLHQETTSGVVTSSSARALAGRSWWVRGVTALILVATTVLVIAVWPRIFSPGRSVTTPQHRQLTFSGSATHPTLSPDGQFLAYIELGGSGETLTVQDLGGGEPLSIFPVSHFLSEFSWLPDGTRLMVSAVVRSDPDESGTYLVHRFGGNPARIGEAGWLFGLSPDGTRYPFTTPSEATKIRVMQVAGGEESVLELDDSVVWPRGADWSPKGDWIALATTGQDDGQSIWLLSPDGSGRDKILDGIRASDPLRSYMVTPRWHPSGDALYYMESHGSTSDLMKVRIDPGNGKRTSEPTAVFTGIESAYGQFSVSRDGRRLAYDRRTGYSNLRYVASETDAMQTRTLTSGTFYDLDPVVSPDGKTVAFSRNGEICTTPIGGGPVKQITFLGANSRPPVWSPDGTEIAFGSDHGGTFRVWVVGASGGTPRSFNGTQMSAYRNMTWAPGMEILYQRPGNRNFHRLDPDTERESPLVENEDAGWMFRPAVSPDASNVAVSWNRDEAGVWVISLRDGTQSYLGPGRYVNGWSQDGNVVYVWSGRKLRGIRVADGQAEELLVWPFDQDLQGDCLLVGNRQDAICTVQQIKTDVWLLEDFDPETN